MVTKDLCIEVFNSMIRGTPVSFGETDTPDTEISLGLEYFLNNEEKREGNFIIRHSKKMADFFLFVL